MATKEIREFTDQPAPAGGDEMLLQQISDMVNRKVTIDNLVDAAIVNGIFSTISVASQSDVVADSLDDTLTLVAGTDIVITTNAGLDTITIASAAAAVNSFETIVVSGQSDVVADSSTDTLTFVAGTNMTITTNAGLDTITFTSADDQDLFDTIAVSGQSDVVADDPNDTLTFVAGSGINITTNAGLDTVTFETTGAGGGIFGGISAEGNATSTTLTVQNTYIQVTVFDTDDPSNGTTPDNTTDDITIATAGTYLIGCHISYQIADSGEEYEFEIRRNNGVTGFLNVHGSLEHSNSSDTHTMTINGLTTLAASDTIELFVRCVTTGSTSITCEDVALTVGRVGP